MRGKFAVLLIVVLLLAVIVESLFLWKSNEESKQVYTENFSIVIDETDLSINEIGSYSTSEDPVLLGTIAIRLQTIGRAANLILKAQSEQPILPVNGEIDATTMLLKMAGDDKRKAQTKAYLGAIQKDLGSFKSGIKPSDSYADKNAEIVGLWKSLLQTTKDAQLDQK